MHKPGISTRSRAQCGARYDALKTAPNLDDIKAANHLAAVTTTITVTAKRHVPLPKALCERKNIRAGTSLRIREDGDVFYVTPVPEAAEAELEAIFKTLHAGRHHLPLTAEDASRIDKEIKKYRAEQRRRKG